jgi:hypothetical protein
MNAVVKQCGSPLLRAGATSDAEVVKAGISAASAACSPSQRANGSFENLHAVCVWQRPGARGTEEVAHEAEGDSGVHFRPGQNLGTDIVPRLIHADGERDTGIGDSVWEWRDSSSSIIGLPTAITRYLANSSACWCRCRFPSGPVVQGNS